MKILVTGASGFVGRSIVDTLRSCGHDIRTAGFSSTSALDFRVPLDGSSDWTVALSGCDGVVHAAGLAHVLDKAAASNLTTFNEINTAGSLNLARTAVTAGVKHFIFISSIAALGEIGPLPARETDMPNPVTPYGRSKYAAERGLAHIAKETGIFLTCLRPPLVYGPEAGGRFAQMMAWCDRRLPLPFGNIDNQRSYLSVENLADAVRICLEKPRAASGTFHLADIGTISTPELLRLIGIGLDKPARLFSVPDWILRTMRVAGLAQPIDKLSQTLLLDTTKFRRSLAWTPPVTLQDGIIDAARRYSRTHQRSGHKDLAS